VRTRVILAVTLLLVIGGMFAFQALLQGNRPGADFYTFWLAGKATFIEGKNPYSEEVTLQAQLGIRGRYALPGEDQLAFAYPVHSLFVLLPVVWMPFDWAQSAWMALLLVGLAAGMLLCFPKSPPWLALSLPFFYPFAFGIILGNFALLAGLAFLAFYVLCLREEKPAALSQVLLGIALAWAVAKPQFAWLHLLFCLLLALRFRLRPFLISFGASLLAFAGLSFLVAPNWIGDWLSHVSAYAGYTGGEMALTTLLRLLLPVSAAQWITVVCLAAALGVTAWLFIRFWQGKTAALAVVSWCGLVTFLFHLHPMAYDQFVFYIPFIVWAAASAHVKTMRILLWWFGALVFSWLAFALGLSIKALDLLPAAGFAVWMGVYWKELSRSEIANERKFLTTEQLC
jgi:hypothetical protein